MQIANEYKCNLRSGHHFAVCVSGSERLSGANRTLLLGQPVASMNQLLAIGFPNRERERERELNGQCRRDGNRVPFGR